MVKGRRLLLTVAIGVLLGGASAAANEMCASTEQAEQIQAFYAENPGAMPAIAARKLGLAEEVVASGLPGNQMNSAPGEDFPEIWDAMDDWGPITFLIMKGMNVFEIASSVGTGVPSTVSDYYNIKYEQPLRGHLRPDLYTSIYAVALPGKDGAVARGVLFYDETGASVFGAFMSGDGPTPADSELAKFDAVMALVGTKPSVCGE